MNVSSPDWTLWRSFGAVVEHGSLSAAARSLGLSQPTLGRHIEALETALGMTLFDRTLQGLRATVTALALYEPVRAAQLSLATAERMAEGRSDTLSGSVRITASMVTAHYVLPAMLRLVRDDYPMIAIELVPSDSSENLLLREADIAVRMFRPTQLELITRKLGEIPIWCCAHQSYLDRAGPVRVPEDLSQHDLVGLDRSDLFILGARQMGYALERDDFALRTDSQTLVWDLTKAGLGVSFAQAGLVRDTPGMVRLLPGFQPPPLEVWLTTHRELFTSPRIRAIYDRLAKALTAYIDTPY